MAVIIGIILTGSVKLLSYISPDVASPHRLEREIEMRDLAERAIDGHGVTDRPAVRGRRAATVNLAESPLSWLKSRHLITARQFDSGEILRADYERAALGPRITMRWEVSSSSSDGGTARLDPTVAQIAAKQRFDAALAAVGSGLSDIAWRVICAGEGLPVAETAMGWPARSGRVVLTLALDRLADFYRLP